MAWTEWNNLGGEIQGAPAAWTVQGTTYLVARGMDDRLYERQSTDGVHFSGWEPHTSGWTSAPPVLALLPHVDVPTLHVVVRGLDGAVWHKRLQGGVWQAFERLESLIRGEPAAGTGSAIDLLADGGSLVRPTLDIVVQGDDRSMYHHSNASPNPQQLFWPVEGNRPLGSPPAVCDDGAGRVYALWQGLEGHGEEGRVYLRYRQGASAWTAAEPLAEDSVVGAVRARCFAGHLEVVARGEDDTLRYWHGQHLEVHADSPILGSTPVLDSRGGDHRHVFIRDHNGQVLQRIFTAQSGYDPILRRRTDRFR